MQVLISEDDLSKLKPGTRADLIANLFPPSKEKRGESTPGFEWEDVVDLTPGQVEEFMSGCSDETKAGLRVIAEKGPVVRGDVLKEAGIENYGHFQGRVTKRTRTVTRDRHAYLFTWDDWSSVENNGVGHYAVKDGTFRSLRIFFNLV